MVQGWMEVEAGERLSKTVRGNIGLNGESNRLPSPAVRDGGLEDEGTELDPKEASKYRGAAAHLNWMGLDRPDVQVAVKESCRKTARPTDRDVGKLKRLARYLQKAPIAVSVSDGQNDSGTDIHMYVGADWAHFE